MRALHWGCMEAQKLSLCPCPNWTLGTGASSFLGMVQTLFFPLCDTWYIRYIHSSTRHTRLCQVTISWASCEAVTRRCGSLELLESCDPQTARNEYWLLGMSQVHAPPSPPTPRVMICWWKLPQQGMPTAQLPSTAKSGESVPQTGPGCRGRSTSVSVISDWDLTVGSPG